MQYATLRNESLYLMYRRFFPVARREVLHVSSAEEMRDHAAKRFAEETPRAGRFGIMLSGGMDSAMMAAFLPPGSVAYTLDYGSDGEQLSEFDEAAHFVPEGVEHKKIRVTRDAFFEMAEELTLRKRVPTVPHDPAIGLMVKAGLADGVTHMASGIGADGRFAGFGNWYADPSYETFRGLVLKQFVAPWLALHEPAPVDWVIGHYTNQGRVDVQAFLAEIGTEGSSVVDTIKAYGMVSMGPLAEMRWAVPFDIKGRGGKYPLRDLFKLLYPGRQPNKKSALPVPYGAWMADYKPHRPEFRTDKLGNFGGKRLYQIYALELYMDMRDRLGWPMPSGMSLFE